MIPRELFRTAIAAAHPAACLPPHLPRAAARPADRAGRRQGRRLDDRRRPKRIISTLGLPPSGSTGIAVTRHGYARPTGGSTMIEAGHPMPDAAGLAGGRARARDSPTRAGPTTWCWCCCRAARRPTGSRPRAGITLADKQAVTRALLRSGANIGEINTVRKHLSRIKGGRLARARAAGARRHACDLRRAGRRPGGDRLRPDRARPDDACGCPRRRRRAIGSICRER